MKTSTCMYLIAGKSISSSVLIERLQEALDINIRLVDNLTVLSRYRFPVTEGNLFLVDLNFVQPAHYHEWSNLLSEKTFTSKVILLNASKENEKELMLNWPSCCGIFSQSTQQKYLEQGIEQILKGQYWISREGMSALLQHFRKQEHSNFKSYNKLTKREVDILKQVMTGASNLQIADRLFLSEHTVKSHLYNVFKKLKVKNRLQAVSWAREYLTAAA